MASAAVKHNPNYRPAPRHADDGKFVPSAPMPWPGTPSDWGARDIFRNFVTLSKNPIAATTEISMTGGHYQAKIGRRHLNVVSDPDLLHLLFVKHSDDMGMARLRQIILKPMIGEGLITAEGAQWQRIRKLMAPVFAPRHVQALAETMRRSADAQMDMLKDHRDGDAFTPKILSIAYAVLSDSLFSGQIEQSSDEVLANINTMLSRMGRPDLADLFELPGFIPRLSHRGGKAAAARVRNAFSEVIANRRQSIARGQTPPEDLLSRLLLAHKGSDEPPLSDAEVLDQLLTFIGAGHETTSRAIGWMLYLLTQDAQAYARCQAEIDGLDIDTISPAEWSKHLSFTMACFDETMRLYPPAPFITRTAKSDISAGEKVIHAGDEILLNLWALHRHRTLWDAPDSFRPERFLPEEKAKLHRFQYLPFGLGPRICIGAQFALQEAAILITLLLRRYKFSYAGQTPPWPVMRVTTQAENGMPMCIEPR